MTIPPTDKECEVILTWMNTYYDFGKLEPWEREFIRDNYYRDDLHDGERMLVVHLTETHLTPLPVSLEKLLEAAK